MHAPSPIIVSRQHLAFALTLSERRVSELIARGDLPKPLRRGAHDLMASTRRYIEFLRTSRTNLSEERTRWVKAKADKEELDLRQRAGELVEVAAMNTVLFERNRQVRDAILSTPDRLAGILAAESRSRESPPVDVQGTASSPCRTHVLGLARNDLSSVCRVPLFGMLRVASVGPSMSQLRPSRGRPAHGGASQSHASSVPHAVEHPVFDTAHRRLKLRLEF